MIILGTNSIKDTGYNVDNSIRFDKNSSQSLSRTCGSSASSYTLSLWVKNCEPQGGDTTAIYWNGAGAKLNWEFNGSSQIYWYDPLTRTTAYYRDVSAWYHLVWSVSSNVGTLYINGSASPGLTNVSSIDSLNSSNQIYIGSDAGAYSPQNGYFSEVCFIDGTALNATDFGEFDSDSPTIWKPKDVSALTFGSNGFYLDFKDSSALGNDVSGNNNDLTANSFSSLNQSTDTCTNNFCTMNPLDNYYASNTYSEGNIKFVTKASGGFAYGTSTIGLSSGKWYAEFDCIATTDSGAYHQVGIVEKPSASTTTSATANIGSSAYSWSYYAADGKSRNNANYSTYGDSWTTGDIIGVYLNLDDNELRFSKNGAIQNSGTAISITAPASNGTGHYFITAGGMSTNASVTFEANFGNPFQSQSSSVSDANGYGAFEYSPTLSGVNYYSINTKNLAEFG